ncbi:putative thiol protease [Diaporthe ampelina]|uniref:Putative thiol protease n=1 Tax=Diaporthe ampelina TaxID=1214573 RepID=A0A0G2F5U9_9PEZI|nr:putative thiol protease [Diaporthe ampelina]
MGDARSIVSEPPKDSNVVAVDAYALVQAILGRTAEKARSDSDRTETLDYDDLPDLRSDMMLSTFDERGPRPDQQPKNVRVGCCNPYALVEAMLGRRIDRNSVNAATLISQVLQTDYDELFDMKNKSVLYAGLQLNEKERIASQLSEKDIHLLNERDLMTPDLSRVQRLQDLEQIGLKDLNQLHVKHARIQNGKIRLVIQANANGNRIARQVSNRELTRTMNEFMTPFRLRNKEDENIPGRDENEWSPPNASWRDMYDYFFQSVNRRLVSDVTNFSIGDGRRRPTHFFDDPTQGASTNSWLIAAIFSVFWASPASINRATRVHPHNERMEDDNEGSRGRRHTLRIRLHDKGGNNNNRTETVEVNYEIPITNSNNEPVFARASDGTDIWPSLYEKAFAKWILGSSNQNEQHPDITSTHSGDPIKAMAQLNGRDPQYFRCENHSSNELLGVVRQNCVNNRTINPMCAWTHATGPMYRGSNLVANHAYSICGYAVVGDRQYIVLRNPFGVTEPAGLTSYPGLLTRMDPELWQPAELLDQGGLFALETRSFKECFQYMGCAK